MGVLRVSIMQMGRRMVAATVTVPEGIDGGGGGRRMGEEGRVKDYVMGGVQVSTLGAIFVVAGRIRTSGAEFHVGRIAEATTANTPVDLRSITTATKNWNNSNIRRQYGPKCRFCRWHGVAPCGGDLRDGVHLPEANVQWHSAVRAQPVVVLYSMLRRVKNLFSASTKLGHRGFGLVHKAMLLSRQMATLKVMDSPGSLQREREFHNEFNLCSNMKSPFVVLLLGFSSNRRSRKLVLVYELMPNWKIYA
ncbi:hypothetical protein Fmac_009366 [Flemingia macrophylla]|uniref:Protein kinase domain-containing protein n=1 Tax=Flemingia macrophylla TaxID=520843 RepID=A0ABD1N013_9FABA